MSQEKRPQRPDYRKTFSRMAPPWADPQHRRQYEITHSNETPYWKVKRFTARDIRDLTGITYRQLNDWENRGLLPSSSRRGRKWRRFDDRESFAILICAQLRQQYGIPIDSMIWVKDQLLTDWQHGFYVAKTKFEMDGASVFLLTDLKHRFTILTSPDLARMSITGFFETSSCQHFLLLKLNRLINRMLLYEDPPFQLFESPAATHLSAIPNRQLWIREVGEATVLESIRKRNFREVHVQLTDGAIRTVFADQDYSGMTLSELDNLSKSWKYQTMILKKNDGEFVKTTRTVAIKPGDNIDGL